MYFRNLLSKIILALCIPFFLWACSTKRNTSTTRLYHSINTQYNIYFNANEAYKEALKAKQDSHQDTLAKILDIYPVYPAKTQSTSSSSESNHDGNLATPFSPIKRPNMNSGQKREAETPSTGGAFGRSIDKTTKAIKLHSIKAKPERDPGKKRDPKYQAWLKQQEFNPFLKNAWLLLGKSEYQDGDYLQAASTFAYTIRIYNSDPEVVAEARMWMAKSNIAMGWYYEAEDIFNQIRLAGGVPENLKHEYNKIYADFLIKQKEYSKAIPFLEEAISKEGGGLQKTRLKYILGQLYKHEGNREKAYKAFDEVHGLSTPYLYSFNARIQQASFVDDANKEQILSQLNKMLKDHKNKDYLDQIYYALGNIYLNDQDTTKAVENYKKSITESTRNGYDKALSDIALGAIYFGQKKYEEAQPIYSDALNLLSKNNENYPLVALRSEVLDELVVYAKAVHLQDSLQTLARMSEPERLLVVNKIIEDIKKKEKEEAELAKREARMAQREENMATGEGSSLFDQQNPNIPTGSVAVGGGSSFYFYNSQTVAQGKSAFQRKWGMRKLEDDWRRKNKQSLSFGEDANLEEQDANIPSDSIPLENEVKESDIYSPEFYLQQIPLTPEAIDASNVIIEDALFNMGKIYKDKLGDYNLAIDAFNTDLRRFPNSSNKEEIYYQLFLIYLKLGDQRMMEQYRSNILREFPESSYAGALSDSNYASNMLNMHQIEDTMYQQTYESYLQGDVNSVRQNYATMKQRYPLSNLMPKFRFLDALTYAQTNDSEGFKSSLKELIAEYPKSDVTPLATEMLKGIMSGKQLSSDNSPFRGMIWDIKFGGDSIDNTIGVDFVADANAEYMLMFVFKPSTVDKNQLIYEVANYNFSNFVYQTFDLSFNSTGALDMLQVRGFKDLQDITLYLDLAFEKNSLMSELSSSIVPIPISVDNYIALMNGKTLNEYFLFLEKNYTKEMITLIRYWNEQRNKNVDDTPIETMPTPKDSEKGDKIEDSSKTDEEKTSDLPKEADSTPILEPQIIPVSPLLPEEEKKEEEKGFGFDDIMSDKQIDKLDGVINTTKDIISNPVDGLKDLFKSKDNGGEGKSKEEKKAEKQAEKEKKQQEKQRKEEEKKKEKLAKEAENARQDSIKNLDKERIENKQAEEKAKQDALKAAQKEKEDLRKQGEQERKEKEKTRKEELKRKEQERKDRLKQKEQERKERLKQRELELKEKERKAKARN